MSEIPYLSPEALRRIAGAPGKASVLADTAKYLPETCRRFGIRSIAEVAYFLGQLVVESDHFRTAQEYASGWDYDISRKPAKARSLGNLKKGDGPKYKGFGMIQTTGAKNQRRAAEALGIVEQWEKDPHVLTQFPYAIFSAGLYWQDNKLSAIAARDTGPGPARRKLVERVTRGVNGPACLGLVERAQATDRAFGELQRAAQARGAAAAFLSRPSDDAAPSGGAGDPPAGPDDEETSSAPIMLGDGGAGVETAQKRLSELGYQLGKADGRFGPATRGAVLAFQADNDLETTGTLDDGTIKALFVAEKRPIVSEREETTADDLRASGSLTIAAADNVGLVGKALAWGSGLTAGAKGLDASGALDATKGAVDKVSTIREIYDSVADVGAWVVAHWYIGAAVAGAALVVFARRAREARVADARSGANLGR